MLKSAQLCALLACAAMWGAAPATAQSLSISPTRLEVAAPAAETVLVVKAAGNEGSVVQVRVMAWKEGTAPDRLKPTRDVVVSPPATRLRPGEEVTMRVVRVKKRAVRGRECYRVLVDRLPNATATEAVRLQVRHSIPLCFAG